MGDDETVINVDALKVEELKKKLENLNSKRTSNNNYESA